MPSQREIVFDAQSERGNLLCPVREMSFLMPSQRKGICNAQSERDRFRCPVRDRELSNILPKSSHASKNTPPVPNGQALHTNISP